MLLRCLESAPQRILTLCVEKRTSQIPANWTPKINEPFYRLFVPTVDTVRNTFVLSTLIKAKKNVLLVGASGACLCVFLLLLPLFACPHHPNRLPFEQVPARLRWCRRT